MNVGNFGNTFVGGTGYSGAGFDLSAYTGLSLVFSPPGVAEFTVTVADGVTMGTIDYVLPNGRIFNANQYVTYVFIDGQVTVAGNWRVRLIYDNDVIVPPEHFISSLGNFLVGP